MAQLYNLILFWLFRLLMFIKVRAEGNR